MRQFIDYEQALELINWNDFGLLDTIRMVNGKIFHSVFEAQDIKDKLKEYQNAIELSGPSSREAGYGVCVYDSIGFLFLHTNNKKIEQLEITDIEITGKN